MSSFRKNVQRAYDSIISVYREASLAHAAFSNKAKEVFKEQKFDQYNLETLKRIKQLKNTKTYQEKLDDFWRTHELIGKIVREIIEDLKQGNSAGLERAVAYLMIKERHFRSGYFKEEMCDKIKRLDLDEAQKEMLREIIFDQIEIAGREFSYFAKLIPKIKADDFVHKIKTYDHQNKLYIKRRLEKMQSFL